MELASGRRLLVERPLLRADAELYRPDPEVKEGVIAQALQTGDTGRMLHHGMQHWPCNGTAGACSVE
eukprot:7234329-Prymnesium_polylepis.1